MNMFAQAASAVAAWWNRGAASAGPEPVIVIPPAAAPEPQMLAAQPPVNLDDPVVVLAETIWMEARSDGKDGMQAVANVVCNRSANPRWWGSSIAGVCLKPMQFSSWNAGSTQLPLVKAAQINGDLEYAIALNLADLAVKGILPDITRGSDSYYATTIKPPAWATPDKFRVQVGTQRFYGLELAEKA